MKHSARKQQKAYEREYLEWYKGKPAQPFQPMPFAQAARAQWTDRPELVNALAKRTRQWPQSEQYTYLHDPTLEHREGRKWRHATSMHLTTSEHGDLLVDVSVHISVTKRYMIRGIEFLDGVFGRPARQAKGFVIATPAGPVQELPPQHGHMRVVFAK
ncbi:MAG: hypothetical protein ABI599_07655 [Flavobacteriales bacterium]